MTTRRGTGSAAVPAARRRRSRAWALLVQTVGACLRYRVTGLAAEAAFFAILSLPPLIFGLAGAVGYVARRFDVRTIAGFQDQVLALASRVLTEDAVADVIAPTLDDVLSGGRFEVISVGFVLALWSGSRALNVFVDTITIMYGLAGHRGIVRTRALSFSLYVVFLLVGTLLIPLVLAGPGVVDRLLPAELEVLGDLYWPVVLLGSVCFLTSLYHLSVPVRTRWRGDLPGAVLTLSVWIAGSVLLRLALSASTGSSSIYGPLAAPIAVLIWLYLISIAVLIGAAFNAAVDKVWPRFSGIRHDDVEQPDADAGEVADGVGPAPAEPDGPDGTRPDDAPATPTRVEASGGPDRRRFFRPRRRPRSASQNTDTILNN